jgi:hypothetical protein
MNAEIWRHLGIPQTESEAEVRRAYAERLKVTNPEDDPEGFKRLRSAYERALENIRWNVRYAEMDAAADDEQDADGDDYTYDYVDDLTKPTPPREHVRRAAPELAAEPDPELDQHDALKQRLAEALAGGKSPWEVQASFQAVAAGPAMERLDVHAETEMWIANLVRRYNGGGALIDHAFAHFKWDGQNRIGDLGASMVGFRESLAHQGEANAFIARVRDRRHEFHDAYKEMTRPLAQRNWPSRVLSFPRIYLVRRFLDFVDDKVPYAYDQLDYAATDWWRKRIQFWLRPLAIFAWVVWAVVVIGVIVLFGVLGDNSDDLRRAASNPAFEARAACVDGYWRSDPVGCNAYLALVPESLLMRQYAGLTALRQARYDDAHLHFTEILRSSPNDPEAQYGLGLALIYNGMSGDVGRGTELVRGALALDPGVSDYFGSRGVATRPEIEPQRSWQSSARLMPEHDVGPNDVAVEGQNVFDEAYAHFGLSEPFSEGRVILECLARTTGRLSDCHIVQETPRNQGHGEVALRVMSTATVTPATLNGEPVDSVPVRVPVVFQLAPE